MLRNQFKEVRDNLIEVGKVKPKYPKDLRIGKLYRISNAFYAIPGTLDLFEVEARYLGIEKEYHKSDGKIDYWYLFNLKGHITKYDASHYSTTFPGWYVITEIC